MSLGFQTATTVVAKRYANVSTRPCCPIQNTPAAERHANTSGRHMTPQGALGFGFLSPKRSSDRSSNSSSSLSKSNALPSPDTPCACSSQQPYGKCCRRYHVSQQTPPQAEDLLRSRYSAYAYRLPSYIMKTTHRSAIELDRRQWKKEILNFCGEYQFYGGVDIIELQMPAPNTTRILFRANLMQWNSPLSFLELATFVCEGNVWYYKSGKLVDVEQSI